MSLITAATRPAAPCAASRLWCGARARALPIAVLVSGTGTNLQALLDTVHGREARGRGGRVERAGAHGAGARRGRTVSDTLCSRARSTRTARRATRRLADWLQERGARLVVLAGYMELLGEAFLERFPGAVINVHPSLLPAFPGIGAVEQALAYGVKVFGVTVHFVDAGVDTGRGRSCSARVELPDAREPAGGARGVAAARARAAAAGGRGCSRAGALSADPENPRRRLDRLDAVGAPAMPRRELGSRWRPRKAADRRRGEWCGARGARRGARAPGAAVGVGQGAASSTSPAGSTSSGVELVSTGGTARELAGAGIAVRAIEDFTGFPEMMDGRVKTLHPRLYAGLLARRDEDAHLRAAAEQEIEQVDLVCVNLYPFEQTLARGDATDEEVDREHRHRRPDDDPGGGQEQRASRPWSWTPSDYERVLGELRGVRRAAVAATRAERSPAKAFACTARYDAAIATWFAREAYEGFPPTWRESYEKVHATCATARTPTSSAAFYARVGSRHAPARRAWSSCTARSCRSTTCSTSARRASWSRSSSEPACAIVKHNNPCGCALGESAQQAYERAFACDPQSAYGGVIAVNRPVDRAARRAAGRAVHRGAARARLRRRPRWRCCRRRRTCACWSWPTGPRPAREVESKPVLGGLLVQTRDAVAETREQMRVDDRAAAERDAVARTCCSRGGSAGTCAPTRSCSPAAAPRSASARAR